MSRVDIIDASDGGEDVLPSFLTDLPGIERGLREQGVDLVLVDGTFGFLGAKDDRSYTQSYSTMLPFIGVIRRLNIGALAIRHVRKSDGTALSRGIGSTGYTALGRSTISIARDREDETGKRRLFAHAGLNVAKEGPTLAFTIEGALIAGFERTVGRAVWQAGAVAMSADDVMGPRIVEDKSAREAASDFLEDLLGPGPQLSREVYSAADKARISRATLRRATKDVGVKRTREGKTGPWIMALAKEGQGMWPA